MNDETSQAALSRFDFTSGALRGSQLMLYPRSLVHRSESHLETMPLARVTALRVSFARHPRQLGWGAALVVLSLIMLALAAPVGSVAHGAAQEMASSGQGVARALYSFFRLIEMVAALLPALAVLGWRGSTTLTIVLAGTERRYSARGRDTLLLDFAELVSERLMASTR